MSRFTLRTLLKNLDDRGVVAAYASWRDAAVPSRRADVVADLTFTMSDEDRVEARLKGLPRKLSDMFDVFLREPGRVYGAQDIAELGENRWSGRPEIEAALVALGREGLVFPASPARDAPVRQLEFAVPTELADCVDQMRRRQENEIHGTITLKGHLNSRYFDAAQRNGDPDDRAAEHARKVYKIYLLEESILARVAKLPDAVRRVWDAALGKYGGLMPVDEVARALGSEERHDLDLVKKCLEESMLGTVAPLRLTRFGIQPSARTVVVFYEVALVCLQRQSATVPADVEDVVSCQVDVVSNIGRFLREIGQSKVQFTVEGRLYKASEKRIMKGLLPVPGGLLDAEAQIRFIYRFCLSRRLLDRSGERALRPTECGRDFDQQPLLDKLGELLSYCVEERGLPGEDYHQVRMRRIVLRLLKRVEPEQWHELPLIPFLARNNYLSRLEELQVEDFFAPRFEIGGYLPRENLQELCWNLVRFIKRRLYPLGLVELGTRGGRPVAVRLSRLGAELLGAVQAGDVGRNTSEIIVNSDFEILLFPEHDEHEALHTFDRFAERQKSDRIHHFRLSRTGLQAALRDGMSVAQVLRALTDRSRTPLPQNVLYALEDWASELEGRSTLEEEPP